VRAASNIIINSPKTVTAMAVVVSARVSLRCAAHILHCTRQPRRHRPRRRRRRLPILPWEHDGGAVAVVDVSIATGRRDVSQPFTHRSRSPRPPRTVYVGPAFRALVRRFRHQQVSWPSCARPSPSTR